MTEMTDAGTEMFFPTAEDMAEFHDADPISLATLEFGHDLCRECGTLLTTAESATCTPCDTEKWLVEMKNHYGD